MKPSRELIKTEPGLSSLDVPREPAGSPHSYNYGVDPNAESEIQLLDYWRAVRKRLWLVISIVVLITMLSVIYVARKPDIYSAGARVQVDLENSGALVGKAPYVFGPTNDPVYFNTQLQILTSPGLMRRVVKALDLERKRDRRGKPSRAWPGSAAALNRPLPQNQRMNCSFTQPLPAPVNLTILPKLNAWLLTLTSSLPA